ncbi:MAG: hypothetical protein F6K65_39665 [Moorea sp. SIO3C2]|nr:hypothetical protein [Moorena sp. SIO3C2]
MPVPPRCPFYSSNGQDAHSTGGQNFFTLASCLLPLASCLLPLAYSLLTAHLR